MSHGFVWVSNAGSLNNPFAALPDPDSLYIGCGSLTGTWGDVYTLIEDDGSNELWLSSPPPNDDNRQAGNAYIGSNPPTGWVRFHGRIVRTQDDLNSLEAEAETEDENEKARAGCP